MNMLDIHKEARKNIPLILHLEFLNYYKKDSKVIYGYCEGKSDISFYVGAIESLNKQGWEVQISYVGGKDGVLALYEKFDWKRFNKLQIVFFIDKDLIEFSNEKLPSKKNIYITDNYSIENDIVNSNTCVRVLIEFFDFDIKNTDKAKIKKIFDEGLEKFINYMVPVMSCIVYLLRKNNKAYLENIEMKRLFNVQNGVLIEKNNHKQKGESEIEYMQRLYGLTLDSGYNSVMGEAEFTAGDKHNKFVRGKYLLWFLVEFSLSVLRDYENMSFRQSVGKPKNRVNFSHSNAMKLVSSKTTLPFSLKKFLKETIEKYINKLESK